MELPPIDHINVFVAVAIAALFNMLWYSPMLLGKYWQKHSGKSHADLEGQVERNIFFDVCVSFITTIILAGIITWAGTVGYLAGAKMGLSLGIGFIVATYLPMVYWEAYPRELMYVHAGSSLLSLMIKGAILAGF